MLLENRVALITGGAKGIGRGIAIRFAAEGCDVAVNALHPEGAQKVAEEVRVLGRRAIAIGADVAKSSEVEAMVARVLGEFGRIDILVNNAGGTGAAKDTPVEDTPEDVWDRIVDVNLKGQFLCCRAVVPHMKKNRYGKIINVSSMGAIHPPAPLAHYHAAKGGVLALTKNLAFELATFNITVNAILPGPIKSEFFNEMLRSMSREEGEAFFRMLAKKVPMQRMGTPEEVAGVALFLASDLSSYVTGEAICCGGGLPLSPYEG
ncbi:MAG: SDR family oxidoreductase [Dehalococcoidales bacterium]|nr:SDR family oxidoreductase [Dehalococcoidales bacterium]